VLTMPTPQWQFTATSTDLLFGGFDVQVASAKAAGSASLVTTLSSILVTGVFVATALEPLALAAIVGCVPYCMCLYEDMALGALTNRKCRLWC